MVDVLDKPGTTRVAIASGILRMQAATLECIRTGAIAKGDVLTVADVGAVMAAKHTPDIIPMCHPLMLTGVSVSFDIDRQQSRVLIEATVKTTGKTGVEMEALTAVAAAALTIYDMAKAIDPAMRIEDIRLARKSGGKRGLIELE